MKIQGHVGSRLSNNFLLLERLHMSYIKDIFYKLWVIFFRLKWVCASGSKCYSCVSKFVSALSKPTPSFIFGFYFIIMLYKLKNHGKPSTKRCTKDIFYKLRVNFFWSQMDMRTRFKMFQLCL